MKTENLPTLIERNKQELTSVSVPSIQKNMNQWLDRALSYLAEQASNSDYLAKALQTGPGMQTAYSALKKCAQMGLQIGGHYAHVYFVPFQDRITAVISAEGLAFAACYGPAAVLETVPEIIEVKEGDDFMYDSGNKKVVHNFNPFDTERQNRDCSGYYALLKYKNGETEFAYAPIKRIKEIRAKYSNDTKKDGKPTQVWENHESEMIKKIAAKIILKKPAAQSEGLSMLMTSDFVSEKVEPASHNITDRASAALDNAMISEPQEKQVNEEPDVKKDSEKNQAKKTNDDQVDIFK